jgi:hypothetical protein
MEPSESQRAEESRVEKSREEQSRTKQSREERQRGKNREYKAAYLTEDTVEYKAERRLRRMKGSESSSINLKNQNIPASRL